MSPYLILGVPLFAIFWNLYWLVVRPARKQRRASGPRLAEGFTPPSAALAPPEPGTPRDTSRPYPRPKGSRSKLNRVCPVCGTGRETGDLDGRVLGWPAHASCAEWLGDWKPVVRGGGEYAAEPALSAISAFGSIVRTGSTNTTHYNGSAGAMPTGGGAGGSSINSIAFASPETMAITEQVKNGLITSDEACERLNQEIVALWGVPPMMLQEHTHKVGDPVPVKRCPKCGARFAGPLDYLRTAYRMHLQVGRRQSSSSPDA